MKNLIFLLTAASLIAGCDSSFRTRGPVTTEKRSIAGFHGVNTDAVAEITLVNDNTSFVEVTTNQNFQPLITTEVNDGVLQVSQKRDFTFPGGTKVTVTVHTSSLDELALSGVGSIKTQNSFPFDRIKLTLSGVGSMNISGSAHLAIMENSGAGSINTRSMVTDSVLASNSGVGSIQCNAVKYLKADVSGVGSISYTGDAVVEKSVSGVGSVHKE